MRGKNISAEDLTAKKELALEVIRRLKAEYPDAGCTLDYDHAWQLLVSVRLAAQCTDARVNIVVQDLFAKYPSVAALAEAEPEDIEAIVKPCGLGRSKARDISACMRRLRDDYGCKVPTTFDELLARLRVMTRKRGGERSNLFTIDDLTLDIRSKRVERGGVELKLSAKEYALLEYLIRNKGVVLSRIQIEENIWGFDYEGSSNIVDVYIRYLRRKIDKDHPVKLIHTIRGSGYVLKLP